MNVRQTLERLDQPILYMNSAEYTEFNRKRYEVEKGIVDKFGLRSQN